MLLFARGGWWGALEFSRGVGLEPQVGGHSTHICLIYLWVGGFYTDSHGFPTRSSDVESLVSSPATSWQAMAWLSGL